MEYGKFIVSGEDKKSLSTVKSALAANGHVFLGYVKEPMNVLRVIRSADPNLVVIDMSGPFKEYKQLLDVIEEDMLCACILIIENINEEIYSFLNSSRVVTYMRKPIFDEIITQVTDFSLMNYRRVIDYETRVRKLNETLESRKIIEKAKWILVEKEGLSEADAYESIKRRSRDNRVPMRDIAEALILTRG
ncbi:MAG TPA: ANTAR domain-containing protein [Clostridia bacterium]|nr:ANTAR domain-containing protein [Clostridia bacterium]